jgi:site-specific DNA recombinase
MCLMLQPMSIILAKLITAMTKEGKFKDAIQDKIGATVDTTDLKKQLSVLNASLHQAETIKTRLEQQMDNLDVTDTHYDKKISDLQRRLDAQYDRIDEAYSECTDAEKKQFMQALIYSRKDGKMEIGFRILSFSFQYRLLKKARK